jgi:hypothetical protein
MPNQQPTFQQAMEITATWLQQWDDEEISDEVLADRIGEMVASRDGARGFFVVTLAGDSALMDRIPDVVAGQLRSAGRDVVDLSVRNLAMSTAMAVHHKRSGDQNQQAGSERVTFPLHRITAAIGADPREGTLGAAARSHHRQQRC